MRAATSPAVTEQPARTDHLGSRSRRGAQPGAAAPGSLPSHLDPRGKQRGRRAARGDLDGGTADPYGAPLAPGQSARDRIEALTPARTERGLAGWLALLLLIAITLGGLLIDAARGVQLGTGFNIGIIAGSVIAILAVRRSGMFPVVVAPPIVYSLGAGLSLYVRSDGLSKRSVLIDAAANWLVYGFPAIAAATAAVLIIAGIRLITRR